MNVKALTGKNKSLLVGRLVAPRPSGKHISLGLTWLDAETFADARLESWGILGWFECIGYDVNNKAVGIEAEVEVDV